ncbi:hypothetical protein ACF3DV_03620 [Chlorogloeopsis fritschii PCC 9212]|jgi:hypothetical protein|uniref:Uncharacterized protein n=1 Tax=Chlorogloeopsis fritschii PCC 6912 TaxID=211165 RepID=A0A3S0ZLS5_CHLFR|nr:hypothetical protein [Chlorogloeopsis fritschii]RUR73043.1 hypothetical protein PCC6912_58900 [Chlorogloeopsis fritschii PCC 6912]
MNLKDIPLSLEELTDETATTISGGVGVFEGAIVIPWAPPKNKAKVPFDLFSNGSGKSNQADESENPEETIQQASEDIELGRNWVKTVKNAF